MNYVTLKHTLAEVALDALAHPEHALLAASLAAYGRMSNRGEPVLLSDLAHEAGLPAPEVDRLLRETGFFEHPDDAEAMTLAAPLRPFAPYLRRQTRRLAEALAALRSPAPPGVPPEVWRGAVLFNAGLFFECHEYLEDVWRAAPPAERNFYHGLVQAAAGCYHLEKGNRHGAQTLTAKAIAKLEPYAPAYLGVDVAALLEGLRGLLGAIAAAPAADAKPARPHAGRARPAGFPTIRLVAPSPGGEGGEQDLMSGKSRVR